MAKGSHAGWHGLPREKRVCAHCGAKLTLHTVGGLWMSEIEALAFHARCWKKWQDARAA